MALMQITVRLSRWHPIYFEEYGATDFFIRIRLFPRTLFVLHNILETLAVTSYHLQNL